MGGHSLPGEGQSVEWYTPPGIIEALGLTYDLDPCSPPGGLPWIPVAEHYTKEDDGLSHQWQGRVFMNPPYGRNIGEWMRRFAVHGNGVALVFARTETEWWHRTVPTLTTACFIRGRLTFVTKSRELGHYNAGAPSVLLAAGEECAAAVRGCGLGMVWELPGEEIAGEQSLWE